MSSQEPNPRQIGGDLGEILCEMGAAEGLSITYRRWLPGEQPACDCPLDPHHRWNCPLTPIWAQTIRELDISPWGALEAADTILAWGFPTICPICNFNVGRECVPGYNAPICSWCWQLNRHREPELWHCADCGQFISGGKRMQVAEAGAVVIVCPEHFAGRAADE